MPIGIIVNALVILLGGFIGAFLGSKVPERLQAALPLTFGIASLCMGVTYIIAMHTLPAVILSLVLGSAIGELIKLEKGIEWCAVCARGPIDRLFSNKGKRDDQKEFMEKFIAILVLFSASGTGVFGALKEGMTGDHSVLLAKAILDFFTAGIFATTLGYIVMTIAIPQFIILISLFLTASFLLPMITPSMVADFTAAGGMIMLATGLRISGIKAFPIANMLPALFLFMPISHLWTTFIH
ncbi:DUF554 domain-containing protein [Aneurinibacillus terranovensis]|uniref:DUF554 domain-containing protein n=1 Tax=Aneurinibacillus terranovensis TaxID=278991 RepID=UPI00040B8E9E|nr:DUF554 domain-containing protein [Aneurinibacillus terranovensis]